MDDSAIICDKVIDSDAEGDAEAKSKEKLSRTTKQILTKKNQQPVKRKIFMFHLHFY